MTRALTFSSLLLLPLVTGVLAVGCGGSSGGGGGAASTAPAATAAGTGQLVVELTDAPLKDLTGVSKAEIVVDRLLIHVAAVGSAGAAPTTSAVAAPGSSSTAAMGSAAAAASPANAGGNNPNAVGAASQGQGANAGGSNPNAMGAASQGQGANAGGNNPNAMGAASQGQGANAGGSWIILFDAAASGGPKTFNLLDLRGGITAELAKAQLPAGLYTGLRLELSGAEIVHNGVSYSTQNGLLQLTGSSTVTLQLARQHQLVVTAGQTAQALLDFDIARSFNLIGNPSAPQGFTLLPTIRAANLASSGSIAGVVRSDNKTPADASDDAPLANATVAATASGTTITTYTDAQGVYVLPGLDAGDWDLLVQATGHDDLARPAVTVVSRQQTTADATLVKQ